jgi:transcriptional regulator with XRE-family HTH domain
MSSLVFDIGERRRAASRFMGRVQREVQRAVAAEKKGRKLTQQQIADMLETSKSVINREILGGNLTLRRLGELAWALGYEIVFEFRKRPVAVGQNQHNVAALPPKPATAETEGTGKLELRRVA